MAANGVYKQYFMPTKQILSADRMWPGGHVFAASAVTVRGSGSVRGGRGLGQTRDLWRTASHTGLKAGVRQGTARGREPGSLGLRGPGTPPARSAGLFFSMLVDLLPKRAPSGLSTGLRRAGHWDTVLCELSVAGVTGHRRRGGFKQQDCSPWRPEARSHRAEIRVSGARLSRSRGCRDLRLHPPTHASAATSPSSGPS